MTRSHLMSAVAFSALLASAALAQEAAPIGSPDATKSIDGTFIPNPAANFGGTIELNAIQSTPSLSA